MRGARATSRTSEGRTSGLMVGSASAPGAIGAVGGALTPRKKRSKSKGSSVDTTGKMNSGAPTTTMKGAPVPSVKTTKPNGTAIPAIPAVLPNATRTSGTSSGSRSRATRTVAQSASQMQSQSERGQSQDQAQGRAMARQQEEQSSQNVTQSHLTRAVSSGTTQGLVSRPSSQDNDKVVMRASVPYSEVFPVKEDRVGPQHFKKLKLLGRGGIGKVFLVLLKGTDKLYAMKVLTKEEMIARNKVKRVMTEREILATANHPFIVTMYASFQTTDRLCFVMEYCEGGEFFRVLQRQPRRRLAENAVRFYAAEVTLALEYLHHLGFIYRDLKPENILMRADGHIALTDFDLSKQAHAIGPRVLEKEQSMIQKIRRTMSMKKASSSLNNLEIVDVEPVLPYQTNSFVGTEEYISPEVVKGVGQTATVDWWTLGILIYEMLTGTTPFKGSYTDETFSNIVNHTLKWPEDVFVSSDGKNLVKRLLKRDCQRRLGAENGASDIKRHRWFKDFNFELIRNEVPPIIPKIRDAKDYAQQHRCSLDENHHETFDDSNPNNVFRDFYIRRDSEVQRHY